MQYALSVYQELEALVQKNSLAALLARWEFGRRLLEERGDAKRLPNGRVKQLSNALDSSWSELSNRMQFAAEYPTEAQVRAAYEDYGGWGAICRSGLGERGKKVLSADNTFDRPLRTRWWQSEYGEVLHRIDNSIGRMESFVTRQLPRMDRGEAEEVRGFLSEWRTKLDTVLAAVEHHIEGEMWLVEEARLKGLLAEITGPETAAGDT